MSTYNSNCSSDDELAGSELSISTENGNKYNNQLHYYDIYGWPEAWGGQSPSNSGSLNFAENFIVEHTDEPVIDSGANDLNSDSLDGSNVARNLQTRSEAPSETKVRRQNIVSVYFTH